MFTGLFTGRARLEALEKRVSELSARHPTTLRIDVDELRAELDALKASVRKQFGRINRARRDEPDEPDSTGDPKLDAILRAQRGQPPPPSPGSPSDEELIERLPQTRN